MTEQEIKQTIELETQYFDLLKAKSNLRLSVLQKKLEAQPEELTGENKLWLFAKHQQYKLKENEKAEQVKAMECRLDDLGIRAGVCPDETSSRREWREFRKELATDLIECLTPDDE